MYLIDALKKFQRKNRNILFTTPGHCQGENLPTILREILGKKIFKIDLSEVIGLDNIRCPENILLKSQEAAAKIYAAKKSFYLYNGSSSGIIALMLTLLKKNDKVLISRNAHISVINGLILTGAMPVWVQNNWIDSWNIVENVNPEDIRKKLDENPDIKAVFLTNPTYEGVICDIEPISRICNARKIPLVVDEAHGALWNFHEKLPKPAILQNAMPLFSHCIKPVILLLKARFCICQKIL
ncbi:MAG: aminotransferase class I/II-fold pyridoxal phosphate-dependent enzyme [Candidatus Gastranaerophilales bacterium]|nr:aminotransferase class I/II-fold pyridoxal phosphate-dependent enzyme [Candidatus Gastranaerophilales bacterium]